MVKQVKITLPGHKYRGKCYVHGCVSIATYYNRLSDLYCCKSCAIEVNKRWKKKVCLSPKERTWALLNEGI